MRSSAMRLLLAGLLATIAACNLHRGRTGPALDRNLLVPEQYADHGYNTVYDVVEALRSNWIADRGPDSFTAPTHVQVYLDGIRVGGPETLRTIDLRPVTYIRFFDGIAATARWGLDHGSGAIYVSTHPLGELTGVSPEAVGRS